MKHQRVLTFIDLTLLIMNIEGIKQRVYHGSIVQIADFGNLHRKFIYEF